MEFSGALCLRGPAVAAWQESTPEHRGELFELGHKLWDQRFAVLRDDAVAEMRVRVQCAVEQRDAARLEAEAIRSAARAEAAEERGRLETRVAEAQIENGHLAERLATDVRELKRSHAEAEEGHAAEKRRLALAAEAATEAAVAQAHAAYREREQESHRVHAAEVERLVSQIPNLAKPTTAAELGQEGEELASEAIAAAVPGSVIVDKSGDAGCGDMWWTPPNYDKAVLVEVKNYASALPLKEVEKFKRDVAANKARLCGAVLIVYGACPSVPTFPGKLTFTTIDDVMFMVVLVAKQELSSSLVSFLELLGVCQLVNRANDEESTRFTHLMLQGVITRAKATLADAESADRNVDSAIKQTRLASEKSKKTIESARLSVAACEKLLSHMFPTGAADVEEEEEEEEGEIDEEDENGEEDVVEDVPVKPKPMARVDMLGLLTVVKLKEMAKAAGVKFFHKMLKKELVDALK